MGPRPGYMSTVADDKGFAENAVGVKPPRSFVLDSSILDGLEMHQINREAVKEDHIEFVFPAGFAEISVFDECRALSLIDDFETMYDLTMRMLVDKDVVINVKNFDGSKTELCAFHVTGKDMDLRGVDMISDYPVLMSWMVDFIGASLLKKYPVPGKKPPQGQAPEPASGKATPSTPAKTEAAGAPS